MGQCRMCRKACESNSLMKDRIFREKFQDIICMWVEIGNDVTQYDVCQKCVTNIAEFYSYKQRSRQILRGIKNPGPILYDDHSALSREEPQTDPDGILSLLDNCDQTVVLPVKTIEQLSPVVKKPVLKPKCKKKPAPAVPGKTRKRYVFRTPEERLAEKLRPKRPLIRKTEAEKAMDPAEYRWQYYKRTTEKYKQTCELCGKRMPHNRMEGHMNGHKGISPYECEYCGQNFNCKLNLRGHISRLHIVGKEVSCTECGKMCTGPSTLKLHMRAVHWEKKYQCSLCGLKILSQHALQRHLNIHTQTRDYVCPHCGKAFYCKSVLKIHLRTHSGETPYICNICPKGFVHRRVYVMHMQKLHPAEPLMKLDGARTLRETLMTKY